MERELQTVSVKNEVAVAAVEKLEGKHIVELVEVALGTALVGLVVICLTGSDVTITKGGVKISSGMKKKIAA